MVPGGAAAGPHGAALTELYLSVIARLGAGADELRAGVKAPELVVSGPCLSRPLFLGHGELDRLYAQSGQVRTALASLPGRLYGGDVTAFARAAGLTGPQAAAVTGGWRPAASGAVDGGPLTGLARADLHLTECGFSMLEFNVGSAVAGVDNDDLCRAMLRHPALAAFARCHHLAYADAMRQLASLIFTETGTAPGSFPSVAITDWPEHYQRNRPYLEAVARRWRAFGLDARACHVADLRRSGGRVWLRGSPVRIVYRLFLLEHLLAEDGPALIGPVLEAARCGEVAMFTPLESEMYGSKAALAMLSDPASRHLFTPAEQAAIDAVVPWTRMVRPGPVTLEDGSTTDLLGYATTHASDLVLKPVLLHGGIGVIPGWDPQVSPAQWHGALTRAMGGPYVLQRRIHPVPEYFPGDAGELVPWTVTWGLFTMGARYGGIWARAFPARSGQLVQRVNTGAHVGCCLSPYTGGSAGPRPAHGPA